MERNTYLSHDALDAIVARIFGWLTPRTNSLPEAGDLVAFSDEWERKQIARELHWN